LTDEATQLPGYVDISPSGLGAKAIGRADRIGGEIERVSRVASATPAASFKRRSV